MSMETCLIHSNECILANIRQYINEAKFFDIFEAEDIKEILQAGEVQLADYLDLIEQCGKNKNGVKSILFLLNARLSLKNLQEAISILKSLSNNLHLSVFNEINKVIELNEHSLEIIQQSQDKENEIKNLNSENAQLKDEISILKESLFTYEFQSKIAQYSNSTDFNSIYQFLENLSAKEDQKYMYLAFEEGLCGKKDEKENTILIKASSTGNFKFVKSLIEWGCDLNAANRNGDTPIMKASAQGHQNIVKYLRENEANKEAKNNSGITSLIYASANGHFDVVKYLIENDANKESKDNNGNSPLSWASSMGNYEIVKYLIENDANKETKNNEGVTPLMKSSAKGHLNIVKYLVINGANKEAKNKDGFTALIYATTNGQLEVVKYLVSVGANIDATDNYGYTSLKWALSNNNEKIIDFLNSAGASVDAPRNTGNRRRNWASIRGKL
ncbi:hypothetical protein TVAG_022620 [Trichomonas vaginalis G3]|uniref:Uncharacterized protein n=1 Tax=Trichomonas vaginalis (strain ATCC PRA-98 / G3) TaxID=412133 RepID=A2GBD7_TRIV3|nr:protein ubiquitination [Trichomonas vaginalis G3]EAX85530.1 hypothetical protein TVAG_022620 [Trichomonas vaginalis G3]KAI5530077.1 protein ubiquitination [Trichomonas vaginalis G3]|eukprot:XP_001298460.1 hypothetical protein [Trichomonas vaginalis G3]